MKRRDQVCSLCGEMWGTHGRRCSYAVFLRGQIRRCEKRRRHPGYHRYRGVHLRGEHAEQ